MPLTDTLTSARKLEESGVPPQQARVLSELLEQTAAAAQQDLKQFIVTHLDSLRDALRSEFRAEIAELRVDLRAEYSKFRDEFRTENSNLRDEFRKELRQQMLWFFAMQIAVAGAVLTLVKFLI